MNNQTDQSAFVPVSPSNERQINDDQNTLMMARIWQQFSTSYSTPPYYCSPAAQELTISNCSPAWSQSSTLSSENGLAPKSLAPNESLGKIL